MKTKISNHRVDVTALQSLLVRYARLLIGNQKVAEDMVLFLLKDQCKYGMLDDSKKVRQELKEQLYLRCFRYRKLHIFFGSVILVHMF